MGEESGGERSGKRRPSRCRVHELPAGGGHDRGWLPSTRQQATRATQTRLAGFSLTRLWMPRPLPLTGPASAHAPVSPPLSARPHCWLRPPATTHAQHFRTLNREKQTCGAMSSSRDHLPPVLPSLKVICARPPRAASHFCWTLQVPSSLVSVPATKFTATSLLLKPNGNLLVSFYLPFR